MSAGPEHWEQVYEAKPETQTSWFRPHLDESLRLIDQLALPTASPLIDVGTGRSTLVDDLLARGFTDLTALDLSGEALAQSHARLGASAGRIRWIECDVLEARLPRAHYALWHDRAAFHFLTESAEQSRYVALAARALRPGGHLLLATFAPDGPEKCSGLPTCRYDAAALAARFAPAFAPVADSREQHHTPFDTTQAFTYVVLRRTEVDPE